MDKLHDSIELHRDVELSEGYNMTLSEWLDKWLNEYKLFTIRESTLNGYRVLCDKYVKRGTGCVYMIKENLWEGKYSPRDAHGNRISRNVYAKTEAECEAKLAELIKQMKAEIEEEKCRMGG